MNMPTSFRQIASADDLHRELIIKAIVVLQEGNELSLDGVYGVVMCSIGQSIEMYVEGCLADDAHEQQILKIIRNTFV